VLAKCRPGNTQNGGTVLAIANLIAESELGSPDSYSSFLVIIRLSRLVSGIFACDRHTNGQTTDGRTTRAITIAGPHIVAGQLISLTVVTSNKIMGGYNTPDIVMKHKRISNITSFFLCMFG